MIGRRCPAAIGAFSVWLILACHGSQSTLAAGGPAGARIAGLWWLMLGLAAAVYAAVSALILIAIFRSRPSQTRKYTTGADRRAERWILAGGAGMPAVLLGVLFVFMLRAIVAVAPRRAADDLVIEVHGKQWWWEIRYPGSLPDRPVTTANEIHVPVGRRVYVRLFSDNVIHSFWVPGLQGKTDLIPGHPTATWIQADTAGVYRGQCAEYCGIQHARMSFLVFAEPEEQFAQWLERQRQSATPPQDSLAVHGQQLFLTRCGICHTVDGTLARGELGPDLTHLASRRTLAAGLLENNPANLTRWIANPQGVKLGNKMPDVLLDSRQLQAIVHYVSTLR